MKPTKKQIWAVKKTIEQYKWARENPKYFKSEYLRIKRFKNYPENSCFLCGYFGCSITFKTSKIKCPLDNRMQCDIARDNPYSLYSSAYFNKNRTEQKKQCTRIINACKRWLKKYDN